MLPITNLPDDALLRRMLAGEEEAFTALYRRWRGRIFRFALHMSGSSAMAEDATQEVFMTLIRQGREFDSRRGTLSAYLFGIARNQVLRRLERERAFAPLPEEAPPSAKANAAGRKNGAHLPVVEPADFERAQTIERVREAVLSLPPHYREVVALCDLQEMSYEEAAAALDCVVGTVRSRLHRARVLLAEKLAGEREPNPKSLATGSGRN